MAFMTKDKKVNFIDIQKISGFLVISFFNEYCNIQLKQFITS